MRRNTYHQDENLLDTDEHQTEIHCNCSATQNPRPALKCFGTNETLERTNAHSAETRNAQCTPHDTN